MSRRLPPGTGRMPPPCEHPALAAPNGNGAQAGGDWGGAEERIELRLLPSLSSALRRLCPLVVMLVVCGASARRRLVCGCGGKGAQVAVVQRRRARTPGNGGAQAGGVSPPFTVCAHSWFEVFGAWEGAGGGWGGGRERNEWQVWCPRRRFASLGPVLSGIGCGGGLRVAVALALLLAVIV